MRIFGLFLLLSVQCSSDAFMAPIWSLSNAMLASSQGGNEADVALSRSVRAGAELAMAECAAQFKNEVWNCPVSAFERRNDKEAGNNRETAFINAIVSAGVTHTVARNCSQGSMAAHCGCERNGLVEEDSWKWGGCSDNVVFGGLVSRQFLDKWTRGEPKSLANLHNNNAGRVAVKRTMRQLCKCHGVSGSCATQTCWRQIGNFKEVGAFLRRQYKRALKVDYSNGSLLKLQSDKNKVQLSANRVERNVQKKKKTVIKKRKLVFLQPSPNYCRMNPGAGYKGVAGRSCVADPSAGNLPEEVRKCSRLCHACGLYAKQEVVEVKTSCNCQFEWCCRIKCQTCVKKQVIVTCVQRPHYNYPFIRSNNT